MFYLKMYIGKLLVAKYQLNYQSFDTVIERQTYQERIAAEMAQEHQKFITLAKSEPVFFVDGVLSKMKS
jgi:hypothetical protein